MTNTIAKLRTDLEKLEKEMGSKLKELQELSLMTDTRSMVLFKRASQDLIYLKNTYDIKAISYKTQLLQSQRKKVS